MRQAGTSAADRLIASPASRYAVGPPGRRWSPPPGQLANSRLDSPVAPPPARPTRSAYVGFPPLPVSTRAFGLPNLRRNVCPHFYMTGSRGAIPIQAPHLLKALIRQDANVSRCQLRGGVHMEQGYVNDVCLTPRFNQCVFYEDELTRE